MIRFAEKLQVLNLRAPAATSDSFNSASVSMKNNQWLTFLVHWGVMDNAATAVVTIKPYSTTNVAGSSDASDTALPFKYRLSSTAANDDMGAITSVAAGTGVALTRTQTARMMLLEIDPSTIPGLDANATNVYLQIATVADHATDAGVIFDVVAITEPRYPQNDQLPTT
jgi:hypothetical protein